MHWLVGIWMRSRDPARRSAWAGLIQTLVERDVQDVAQIEHLSHIPRLLEVAAALVANSSMRHKSAVRSHWMPARLRSTWGFSKKLFLVQRLPAWGRNELGRLIKTPKLHFLDAGLQALSRDSLPKCSQSTVSAGARY